MTTSATMQMHHQSFMIYDILSIKQGTIWMLAICGDIHPSSPHRPRPSKPEIPLVYQKTLQNTTHTCHKHMKISGLLSNNQSHLNRHTPHLSNARKYIISAQKSTMLERPSCWIRWVNSIPHLDVATNM